MNYKYQHKTKSELRDYIDREIKLQGVGADLNCIDVSLLREMSYVFLSSVFNGDISSWNTSKVKHMRKNFY